MQSKVVFPFLCSPFSFCRTLPTDKHPSQHTVSRGCTAQKPEVQSLWQYGSKARVEHTEGNFQLRELRGVGDGLRRLETEL